MNIVFPTYEKHFSYNIKFLNSFNIHCKDKENVSIFFICSKSNIDIFKNIVTSFSNINIFVYTLSDLVKLVDNIDIDDNISHFNQKYSYQSLKKLLAYSIIKDDYIVLDSENLCLKDFYFKDIWNTLKKKTFYYTTYIYDDLSKKVLGNVNTMLNTEYPYWFFNTSYWFFEYEHVNSLMQYFINNGSGSIFDQLKNVCFFEYQLYCVFLLKTNKKQVQDIFTIANKNYNFEKYLINIEWFWAYVCRILNEDNVQAYCSFLDETNERITRLHWMSDNIKYKILENSNVCIGTFHWD